MRDSEWRETHAFSGAVLAGGRSTRMGTDKAFLKIGAALLIERQLSCLRECGAQECIVSGREGVDYSSLGATIVHDEQPDLGPLGGLTAVLERASCPLVLVLAVDMPRMSVRMLREIFAGCEQGCGCVPVHDERFEPLAAAYPKSVLPLAERCLAQGRLSMQAFVRSAIEADFVRPLPIEPSQENYFMNCNEPSDWDALKRQFER